MKRQVQKNESNGKEERGHERKRRSVRGEKAGTNRTSKLCVAVT